MNTTLHGKVHTNMEYIMKLSGASLTNKRSKHSLRYERLVAMLNECSGNGLIEMEHLECTINPTTYFNIKNLMFKEDKPRSFGLTEDEDFTLLTVSEYKRLIDFNNSRNHMLDLHAYLYIKSLIYKRAPNEAATKDNPQCYRLSQKQIADACGVTVPTITKVITHLADDLNLIAYEKPSNVRREHRWDNLPDMALPTNSFVNLKTVYVLKTPGYENELRTGVEKYIREVTANYKGIKQN